MGVLQQKDLEVLLYQHGDFAEKFMIGTTRESVNRMLSALKDEGTISFVDGLIVIHHLENLRRVCYCPSFTTCPKEFAAFD